MNAATTPFSTFVPEVLGQIVQSVTRNKTTLVKVEDVMPERSATNAVRYVVKDNKDKRYFGTIKVCDFGETDKTYFFIEDGLKFPAEDAEEATSTAKPFKAGVTISIDLSFIMDMKKDVGRIEAKCLEFKKIVGNDRKRDKANHNLFRTSLTNGMGKMEIDGEAFAIACRGYIDIVEPMIDFAIVVAKLNFKKMIDSASDLMSAKLKLRSQEIETSNVKK